MNVHLLRSSEVDEELFENVFSIVEKYSGPLRFRAETAFITFSAKEITRAKFHEEKFDQMELYRISDKMFYQSPMVFKPWPPEFPEYVESVGWEAIFKKCDSHRKQQKINAEDQLILLTGYANDKNWFSVRDPSGKRNGFVHTGHWEYYLPCDPRFPVAFEVMETLLQSLLFHDTAETLRCMHRHPRGCINDFCKEKKQITLKLRTADICPACQELLHDRGVDPRITDQVLNTLESLRKQMLFRERYKTTRLPSRLEVRGPMRRIFLTDFGDAELKLTPLERTIYLLFLQHPGGIRLSELIDYRPWIEGTYQVIGNARTVAEFRNSVDQLVDPTENSLNEKLSRIRRKIVSLVGEDLAGHYVIDGPKNEKKLIALPASMIRFVEHPAAD